MAGGLGWVPSLIVFGVAAVLAVAAIIGFRRLGARRERADAAANRELEVRAKVLLVTADNALREGDDEAAFAEAQFGAREAADYRRTLEAARARLREAFLLQQRLDDAEPDTAAERRSWASRIVGLCESAIGELERMDAAIGRLRAAERGVDDELPSLEEDADLLERRLDAGDETLGRLDGRFAPTALAGFRDAASRARASIAEGREALVLARARSARPRAGESSAEAVQRAAARLERAQREVSALERAELDLAAAASEARIVAAELDDAIGEGRREQQRTEDPEAATRLGEAIDRATEALMSPEADPPDPVVERERLRVAATRLDSARAAARTAQGRLDGARGALDGAIAIARSQIRAADSVIGRARGAVGAEARTRFAEAERQLQIALDEADPVAALDAARRATSLANDAEALARYDALGR